MAHHAELELTDEFVKSKSNPNEYKSLHAFFYLCIVLVSSVKQKG